MLISISCLAGIAILNFQACFQKVAKQLSDPCQWFECDKLEAVRLLIVFLVGKRHIQWVHLIVCALASGGISGRSCARGSSEGVGRFFRPTYAIQRVCPWVGRAWPEDGERVWAFAGARVQFDPQASVGDCSSSRWSATALLQGTWSDEDYDALSLPLLTLYAREEPFFWLLSPQHCTLLSITANVTISQKKAAKMVSVMKLYLSNYPRAYLNVAFLWTSKGHVR